MSDNKRTPDIRISGFTEDWEPLKLTDAVTLFSGLTYSPNNIVKDNGTLVLRSSNVKNGEIVDADNVYVDPEVVNVDNVQVGDIIVVVRNGSRSLIGKHGQIKVSSDKTVIGAFMSGLRSEHPEFINALLDTNLFKAEIDKNLGATINQITNGMFHQMEFLMPSNKEQDEIGRFFKNLDNLITLHQRKYDKLLLIKKSMLEKMFPKEGEVLPEIRFSGYIDTWKQVKLGDYLVQHTQVTTVNNQYPALTSSRRGIFFQTEYFAGNQIASADNRGYNVVPRGYFTYRHMSDDEIFFFNINNITEYGIVSTLYPVFTTNDELDSMYLKYQLNHGCEMRKYAVLQKQGGSRTYMYFSKLKELKLTIPLELGEQKKISDYFEKLDQLIILNKGKLDKLKLIKKSMLEKMFV